MVVNGFPEDPVNDVVSDITRSGGIATAFIADISSEANAMACIDFTIQKYGKLNILVNNAGVFPVMEKMPNYPTDAFEYLIKNNVRTAFVMTKYAIPELKKTMGCILYAGSEAGEKGLAENAPYGAPRALCMHL